MDNNLTQILNDAAAHAKLKEHRISRDEALDLAFEGWRIASGRCGDRPYEVDWTRWTEVHLYVTVSGKFVTSIERHSRWQGQNSRYDATVHDSFAEARDELIGAARLAITCLQGEMTINAAAIGAQVRSLAADLLSASGLTRDELGDLLAFD